MKPKEGRLKECTQKIKEWNQKMKEWTHKIKKWTMNSYLLSEKDITYRIFLPSTTITEYPIGAP